MVFIERIDNCSIDVGGTVFIALNNFSKNFALQTSDLFLLKIEFFIKIFTFGVNPGILKYLIIMNYRKFSQQKPII
jgi:hypothetical protein